MEERISFSSDNLKIEGFFSKGTSSKGVVITHPHTLYGGNMDNPVVDTIKYSYQEKGYSTLKFNFRGAGYSEGSFDEGIGEQSDVSAAIDFLFSKGCESVDLAGYSFGSWVNAAFFSEKSKIENMIMVSPPVSFISFKPYKQLKCLKFVISGEFDEFAPVEMVKEILPNWNKNAGLTILKGSDHFYSTGLSELKKNLLLNI